MASNLMGAFADGLAPTRLRGLRIIDNGCPQPLLDHHGARLNPVIVEHDAEPLEASHRQLSCWSSQRALVPFVGSCAFSAKSTSCAAASPINPLTYARVYFGAMADELSSQVDCRRGDIVLQPLSVDLVELSEQLAYVFIADEVDRLAGKDMTAKIRAIRPIAQVSAMQTSCFPPSACKDAFPSAWQHMAASGWPSADTC